jgi:Holliday junction resolvase RusA-like endonuclease
MIVLSFSDAPPSANNLFATVGARRFKTKAYRSWIKSAGLELMIQRPPMLAEPVDIALDVEEASGRRSDADGKLKAICDLLVRHNVIPDDSSVYVRSTSSRWVPGLKGCRITITPASESESA